MLIFTIITFWITFSHTKLWGQAECSAPTLNIVDSGFLFLIGPHDHFLFVPSKKVKIEELFNSNCISNFFHVHIDEISLDNYTLLEKNEIIKKPSIKFKSGQFSMDSLKYSRVYLIIKVPVTKITSKEKISKLSLLYKMGSKKLWYFTKSETEIFEAKLLDVYPY